MTDVFIILFAAHLVGDFYCQSKGLSLKKTNQYRYVLLHGLYYAIAALVFLVFQPTLAVLLLSLGFAGFHLIIDTGKFFILKSTKLKGINPGKFMYAGDQILHVASLVLLAAVLFDTLQVRPLFANFLMRYDWSMTTVVRLILLFLLIFKPANVTFRNLFGQLKPEDDLAKAEQDRRAGAVIGNMERLLIALLMLLGQYTAIGLVLTGKSIARYKKIAEEKSFAEYYLIGTFYSLIVVIGPFMILC